MSDQVWVRGENVAEVIVVWVCKVSLPVVQCCWRILAKRGVMLPPPRADVIKSERSGRVT